MQDIDLLYYIAGLLLILMAYLRDILHMRICHLVAGAFFVAYGIAAEVWPVAILNSAMMLVHVFRLPGANRLRRDP